MLAKIIENKRKEIGISKRNMPLNSFIYRLKNVKRDFKGSLLQNKLNLIAEIKRTSPSQNIINQELDIKQIVKIYNKYADAISVLTDKKFFDGSLMDIKIVSKLSKLPILRKDFIIDEYQIYESRFYNADAILLIASILSTYELNNFIDIAKNYGMECLVEVNTEEELNKVLNSNTTIIGINNRDLNTLKVDTETTLRLIDKIPKSKIVVSESGISSKNYIEGLIGKVNAILVGTLFMNSTQLEEDIISLIK
ncbi:MAG: Indole-3-glycerol phosphate synthase [Parcubacteria group bacterium GW2011_GWA2_48_9]|nr:MAG: Indole-3-glycerol phosphate synthase [Parcubacteria group bacterium GW2011_GWA2_48_9]